MGCAPSKQNAEFDVDEENRPLPNDKKAPKSRKPPSNDHSGKKSDAKDQTANNNANKEAPPVEEVIQSTDAASTAAAPSEPNGQAPVQEDEIAVCVPNNLESCPESPHLDTSVKYGDIWDMTKGMPKMTSPYDVNKTAPPKPERTYESEGEEAGRSKSYHTFPRSRDRQRPVSARDRYLEESEREAKLERKPSLRERTPQRRKDLDLSGNIYMGKNIELPGRGHKLDETTLEFLRRDGHPDHKDDLNLPKYSVRERAQAYLDAMKKREQREQSMSPIRRPVRKLIEEDSEDEGINASTDGNTSIIEIINKEILDGYQEVPKRTFEEIKEELIAEAHRLEQERIEREEAERRRIEEQERERQRLEEEERERQRAEEEERERLRLEEEEERERLRLEEEEERERLRLEEEEERRRVEELERERLQLEEEARDVVSSLIQAEDQSHLEDVSEEAIVLEAEGGEPDPAEVGAQLEDRFYNNKAFEKPDIDSSNPEQQDAALKIQTKYRQHHAKQVVDEKRQEQAAVKIQAGYRGWHDRKRVEDIKHQAETRSQVDAQRAEEDDLQGDEVNYDDPEYVNAATTIQAGYKGFRARQEVQKLKNQKASEGETQLEKPIDLVAEDTAASTAPGGDLEDEAPADTDDVADETTGSDLGEGNSEQDAAAAKIQAGVRGYIARKRVKVIKASNETSLPAPGEETPAEQLEETADTQEEMAETQDEIAETQDETAETQEGSAEEPDETAEPQDLTVEVQEESAAAAEETDDKVINYDDPEVQLAATKIQAGFKGMHARKQVQALKISKTADQSAVDEPEQEAFEPEPEPEVADPEVEEAQTSEQNEEAENDKIDIDMNDPEVQLAATKIQAGFKGYKTRKELESKKNVPQEEGGEEDDGTAAEEQKEEDGTAD